MEHLIHKIPTIEDKDAAIDYINELIAANSSINGAGGLARYLDNYEEWLEKLENDRNYIADEERVPADTYYLVRIEDNKIVGMINIRRSLNKRLEECGGHIGYSIRPSERKKGYNKINLYLALLRCQELNIKEIYLDCNTDNPASYKSMEALDGIRIKEYVSEYEPGNIYRYLINVDEALKNHQKEYEPKILRLK